MKKYALALAVSLIGASSPALAASFYNCSIDAGCVKSTPLLSFDLSTYAKTNYPVVLTHGMLGFNQIAGTSYWYGMPEDLSQHGASVFVTKVSAANNSDVRGEELLKQVRMVMAITGKTKVNLIGHSQGGPDVRYVLGVSPSAVASATTVGSPHKGATLADEIEKLRTNPTLSGASPLLVDSVNGLGKLVDLLSGGKADAATKQNSLGTLASLTTSGSLAFNSRFPQGLPSTACGTGSARAANGAYLFSWSGVTPVTTGIDISDPILTLTSLVYKEPNDGLVGRCSSHFGTVIKDNYLMNHLDETNQVLGLVSVIDNPTAIMRQHANRLKTLGL